MLVKFNMDRITRFNLCPRVGGDDLGVETLGHVCNGFHYTLYIHNHCVHGASYNGQLLLQKVTTKRNSVPHEKLIGRTAYAA